MIPESLCGMNGGIDCSGLKFIWFTALPAPIAAGGQEDRDEEVSRPDADSQFSLNTASRLMQIEC